MQAFPLPTLYVQEGLHSSRQDLPSISDLHCGSEIPSFNHRSFEWSWERFRGTGQIINSGHVLVVECIRSL